MVFFAHPGAAVEAGYRACKRCRPELAPGNTEWNRSETLTAAAVRLIDDGAVDRGGVAGLAGRLGVSERHLRRELQTTLGTGPLALARSRRLRVARLLLDSTTMTATDVAFAAGFGSVRQFNHDMRVGFGATPTELRTRRGAGPVSSFTVSLPARSPVDPSVLLNFWQPRAIPGVETVTETSYRRTLPEGTVTITPRHDSVGLTFDVDRLSGVSDVVQRARRLADLDADLNNIRAALSTDPLLAARLETHPVPRLVGGWDPFEVAVRAVVGQQVSVAGAITVIGRIVERSGGPPGFPTPDAVSTADLTGVGMPTSRIEALQTVARAMASGEIIIDAASSSQDIIEQLTGLRGIGSWTANYVAMRTRPDPDGWPAGDLGLRRSSGLAEGELLSRSEEWRPWRAYAALLLWASDPTQQTEPRPKETS